MERMCKARGDRKADEQGKGEENRKGNENRELERKDRFGSIKEKKKVLSNRIIYLLPLFFLVDSCWVLLFISAWCCEIAKVH